MPYWNYSAWISNRFSSSPHLDILEVGVDTGRMLVGLAKALPEKTFNITGLDVRFIEKTSNDIMSCNASLNDGQNISYLIKNSLEWLPSCKNQFDLMLIDGDHNYYTVTKELEQIDRLLRDGGCVIVDDYKTKWAKRDLFYSQRETHDGIDISTDLVETEKHGVQTAVDDFLEANSTKWKKTRPLGGDAVVLERQ
jgi:predicted O-methyltransferase YrrM